MFHEYALEPAVLSSWERVRYFLDAFGPWRGRFLANYPRRWKRAVIDGLRCPDVERTRIVERLNVLDKRVFSGRSKAPYDGLRSWIENALAEHQREPFHAIIAAEHSPESHVIDGSKIDDSDELWRTEPGQLVARDALAIVGALKTLLMASKRIVIIDPHFRADQHDKTQPIVALGALLAGSGSTLEVHCSDAAYSYHEGMRVANRDLPKVLPLGIEITICIWKERVGGRRLHNRYVLTDLGGVKFGDTIAQGEVGQQDHLSILDEGSRSALWDDYVGSSPAFDPAGPSSSFRRGR